MLKITLKHTCYSAIRIASNPSRYEILYMGSVLISRGVPTYKIEPSCNSLAQLIGRNSYISNLFLTSANPPDAVPLLLDT